MSPEYIEGRGITEVLDVTGMPGRDASSLALVLARWSGPGQVYKRRADGRRRLVPRSFTANLNSPFLRQVGVADQLREAIRHGDIELERHEYYDPPDSEWAQLFEAHYSGGAE